MAGEAGFLYEQKIHNKLKKAGLVPAGFTPAGSDPNAPDGMFIYGGKANKLEIKLDLKADFGQGTLDYNKTTKKWQLGGAATPAANEMRKLLTAVGTVKFANDQWGKYGMPMKYAIPTADFKKIHVDHDYQYFKDAFLDVPSSYIAKYYNSKSTYYIQIGGYGLYHMGRDVARIGTPAFNVPLKLRIRLKRGGSSPLNNYRFTTALQVAGKPIPSSRNLDSDLTFLK